MAPIVRRESLQETADSPSPAPSGPSTRPAAATAIVVTRPREGVIAGPLALHAALRGNGEANRSVGSLSDGHGSGDSEMWKARSPVPGVREPSVANTRKDQR